MIRKVKYANNIIRDDGTTTVAVVVEMDKEMVNRLQGNCARYSQGLPYGRYGCGEAIMLVQEILNEAGCNG